MCQISCGQCVQNVFCFIQIPGLVWCVCEWGEGGGRGGAGLCLVCLFLFVLLLSLSFYLRCFLSFFLSLLFAVP